MSLNTVTPKKALNKAFLKIKPVRSDIESFKSNLKQLLDGIRDGESEEFHKNLVSDFLKNTWYAPSHFINTKGRNDLVIHNGKDAASPVGVIIETKKPGNKSEMLRKNALNVKALQELLLYYLRERLIHKNLDLKYLVATNIHEWFVFDAHLFEKLFARNKSLVQQFTDFEAGRMSGKTTDFFYREIAEPAIAAVTGELSFVWFDLREYEAPLRNTNPDDDRTLIALFKLLSPGHLLKLPFANDSNSLDKSFYAELLHIIGLTEAAEGGKKVIERKKPGERFSGSLLENAILQIDSLDKISRLENPAQYGETREERLFSVGMELAITWINRILFLKLLEAQLVAYHKGDQSYRFLHINRIREYDDLNALFFQVLARAPEDRNEDVRTVFEKAPYLNSSLFEISDIEDRTIVISNLRDDRKMPLYQGTVLKDTAGKKRTGDMNALQYLFEFLDAYDFAGEGSEDIQEDNKTLINASVLGLIFEKINGYKDGSYYTPGFITMYMCRETVRRSVVRRFNELKGWNCTDFDQLFDRISDKKEANDIVNSLKICDPAVGSGHFLVSALNEIIAVKSELKILLDRQGRTLRDYHVEVINDELIVTDDDGALFAYNPRNPESRRVQEALFHEKQSIIENCLFGVDINPNSVKICRLRLWIELLKNAYYEQENRLQTLPNIDINIKCGNSVVSRFGLDADLKEALRKSKFSMDAYRLAVRQYHHARNKDEKRELERLISSIKGDFRSEIGKNDPKVLKLSRLGGELFNLVHQVQLFGLSEKEQAEQQKKQAKLQQEINQLKDEIDSIKENRIYENAFEWRFEFPEILDDEGNFTGFDAVIGNPPYIRQEELTPFKHYLQQHYGTYAGTADLYVYFVERGMQVLRPDGEFSYILPNKWMRAGYGDRMRQYLKHKRIHSISDFGDLAVFEEATTYPCILEMQNTGPADTFQVIPVDSLRFEEGLSAYMRERAYPVHTASLQDSGWTLSNEKVQSLLEKLRTRGTPLGEFVQGKIYYGIKTGLNEAFVINAATRERLIAEDPRSAEVIRPFLAGKDVKRYQRPGGDKYLILFEKGFTNKQRGSTPPEEWFRTNYPAVHEHLILFEEKARNRSDKGDYWWELRACEYYGEFEKNKIVYPNICRQPEFTLDNEGIYTNQKCFIIPLDNRFLLGYLNSSVVFFLFRNILPMLRGGFYEPSSLYFDKFPVPYPSEEQKSRLETLVTHIMTLRESDPGADTSQPESDIDRLVYSLFDLSEEEIGVIEGQ